MGVIGVAVFQELQRRPYPLPSPPIGRNRSYEQQASKAAAAAGEMESATDSVAQQRMGTGHGQREWSPVGQTTFMRASRNPAQVTQLRYDDTYRLVAMGILPRYAPRQYPRDDRPQAFPNGFVADPPRN